MLDLEFVIINPARSYQFLALLVVSALLYRHGMVSESFCEAGQSVLPLLGGTSDLQGDVLIR